MNKISFEKVKEIFLSQYPEGNIEKNVENKGIYNTFIIFKKGGKVYNYKVKNYLQLLAKLNIRVKVLYMREYRALQKEKQSIEKELSLGFIPGSEEWGIKDYILSPLEKKQRRKRLEEIEEIIKESYIF
jgi:hypothetical protein